MVEAPSMGALKDVAEALAKLKRISHPPTMQEKSPVAKTTAMGKLRVVLGNASNCHQERQHFPFYSLFFLSFPNLSTHSLH